MRLALALAALVMLAGAGPGWADVSPISISEALRRPTYTQSYDRMMSSGGSIQPWFASSSAAFHDRNLSSSIVDVDGHSMLLIVFCEPRYCDTGSFAVLFDEHRATGASNVNGALQLFGGPNVFEANRLIGAFLP